MDLEETNKQLQNILRKEIWVRQEILNILSQQESVLLAGNINFVEELTQKNRFFTRFLKVLMRKRGVLTRHLFTILSSSNTLEKTLDKVLDPTKEEEGETLFLYQKTYFLIEKIHSKHLHIKVLLENFQKEGVFKAPKMEKQFETKKLSLMTIDYPNEEQESSIPH